MGMQRLSHILNRNSEKLLSVSLLLELGAVKAFSWAIGSLWNSTANLQTHSGYQRKGSQETLYFHHNFHHLGPHKHSMGWKYRNLAITKSYLLNEAIKSHQYCIKQYKLGKEDLVSVKKVSAAGSPSVARLQVLCQARVHEAQYSKPHENQPWDHSTVLKTMTEPKCPLTSPQDTRSLQTGTPASDWIISAKPNASDVRQNN